jgi:cell wall-associated NlpC family hydrolase
MAVAVKPSKSLLNIRSGIKSIKDSFSGLRKNSENLNEVMLKKTKVKRESIARNYILSQRRKEEERRKNKEDLLEASSIGGAIKRQGRAIASSTKGFLGRIMDFLSTLLVGWLLTNLPSIITMAQELIARIQRLYTIVTGFFNNTVNLFKGFGKLLSAVGKNILTFDFTDSKGRVESALKDLGGTFDDMQSQFDEGFKLLTTSLGEGVVSGEDAQSFGTQYENESMQEQPSGGTSGGANLSSTQKQALGILSKYESAGAGGYNAVNQIGIRGGRGVMGYSGDFTRMPQHGGRPLTDLTIAEIMALQAKRPGMSNQEWIRQGRLHAVGRYQFIGGTLPGVVKRSGIPINAKFTPEVQDLLALQYLKEAGIGAWIGPSDKATREERMVIERARKEPINYKPPISSGSSQQQSQIPSTPRPAPRPPEPNQSNQSAGASQSLAKTAENLQRKRLDTSRYGRDGCVFAVNEVYKAAGMTPPWGSSVYVPTAREKLIKAGYKNVGVKNAAPGDIVIFRDNGSPPWIHIGVVSTTGTVIHNSSTNRALTNNEPFSSVMRRYVETEVYRAPYSDSPRLTASETQSLINKTGNNARTIQQAQITPSGTQQRRQASQQLAQQPAGPSIIIIEEEPPVPQPQVSAGGGGAMMIPIVINPLNSFITKKLLLDLAYT